MRDVHYLRTAVGDPGALDDQARGCLAISERDGALVVQVFSDVGSGLTTRRLGYRRLLRCVRAQQADRLIAESVYRLSTDPGERARLLYELATLQVEVVIWGQDGWPDPLTLCPTG